MQIKLFEQGEKYGQVSDAIIVTGPLQKTISCITDTLVL